MTPPAQPILPPRAREGARRTDGGSLAGNSPGISPKSAPIRLSAPSPAFAGEGFGSELRDKIPLHSRVQGKGSCASASSGLSHDS